jgi:hypothetical protein
VVLAATVTANQNTGEDGVVAALQGSGLSAANLSGVFSSGTQFAPTLDWTFTLPVPFSQMKNTLGSLANIQKTIGQKNVGMAMTFSVQGTQVSPQLQASQQCSIPDLVADAEGQAQKLADAAGFHLGPVMTLSTGSSTGTAVPLAVGFPTGVFRGLASFLLGDVSANSPGCSLVVKFALYGSGLF